MFVAVALAALGIGMWMRADRLEKRANWHQEEAIRFSNHAQIPWVSGFPKNPITEQHDAQRQRDEKARAEYHESMAAKYRRSVWRPWVQLESDPQPATH